MDISERRRPQNRPLAGAPERVPPRDRPETPLHDASPKSKTGDNRQISSSPAPDTTLAALVAKTEAAKRQLVRMQAAKDTAEGQGISGAFNHVLGNFHSKDDRVSASLLDASASAARLSDILERYHQKAKVSPAGSEAERAAITGLSRELAAFEQIKTDFGKQLLDYQGNNKFWSGITADATSTLMLIGGTALAATVVGAPVGLGLIAAAGLGGALSLGAHALLDSQYDIGKEGAYNFVTGALGGGLSLGYGLLVRHAEQPLMMYGIRAGLLGGSNSFAGSLAYEGSNGWQQGWLARSSQQFTIGVVTGGILGSAGHKIFKGMPGTPLAAGAQGMATGGAGGLITSTLIEGSRGFDEGSGERIARQVAGGALLGGATRAIERSYAVKTEKLANRMNPAAYKAWQAHDKQQRDRLVQSIRDDKSLMADIRALEQAFKQRRLGPQADQAYQLKANAILERIAAKQGQAYGFEPARVLPLPLEMARRGYKGYHYRDRGEVEINLSMSPKEMLNALVHEQSHAMQGQFARAYQSNQLKPEHPMYEAAKAWHENFQPQHYKDNLGGKKYSRIAYLTQPIEKHAFETGQSVASSVFN